MDKTAQHLQALETMCDDYKAWIKDLYQRQRSELVTEFLKQQPADFVNDIITILKAPLIEIIHHEPADADVCDARWLIRALDRLALDLNPPQKESP